MPIHPLDDTIVAIASPSAGAARGIVRLSGPEAITCLMRFFRPNEEQTVPALPAPHFIEGVLQLPELHSSLPCDAYFWTPPLSASCDGLSASCDEESFRPERACQSLPAPRVNAPSARIRSYTGQPVVEIHTLGSPPLLRMLLGQLCMAGARLAERGEFTLRAFLAGRIDLTQAEAVLGVIDAETSAELDAALGQLAGGLARPLHHLREALIELLAHLEAGFDFADEDIAFITPQELERRLAAVEQEMAAVRRQVDGRTESTPEVRIVLIGRPNTGKSSLFNALVGDATALVSDHPGTTRDYVTAEINLAGMRCHLVDTAGFAATPPPLSDSLLHDIHHAAESTAAVQRRRAQIEVLCLDSTRALDAWESAELAGLGETRRIGVLTKCDVLSRNRQRADSMPSPDGTFETNTVETRIIETSSLTGRGITVLREKLHGLAVAASGSSDGVVTGTAVRCAESLRLATDSLDRARKMAAAGRDELVAAEIRTALVELGKVVGEVYSDDVLDSIFSRFCVGK